MLKQRIITGVVLAPLTLACVFFLGANAFAIFCCIVILIGAWEWGPLMGLTSHLGRLAFMAIVSTIMAILAVTSPIDTMWSSSGALHPVYQGILILAAIWWAIAALLVYSYPNSAGTWRDNLLVKGLIGLLSLIPAWVAFIAIRTINIDSEIGW